MNVKISTLCKKNAMKRMKLRDAAHLQYFPQLSISCQLVHPMLSQRDNTCSE